jgi:alpha-L-fucosidase
MKKAIVTIIILFTLYRVNAQKFEPTIKSLMQYECPQWFKDAKFGIWSCWNAFTVPGEGDWYARNMYIQGHRHYKYHVENYGHPSEFGYKDIVDLWKGEKFNPEEQIRLFKRAGAKYFIAMANHHDNFDLWDSKHQPWNSVNYGPKIDVMGKWREVTLKHGLRWGITSHAERTWSWLQTAKHSDKTGPKAGVPYDGADPRYEQIYLPAEPTGDSNRAQPVNATPWWREYWLKRMQDLIDNYKPDLFYVDGGVPFPGDDKGKTGLEMMAHLYNKNASWHNGTNEAVMCIKNWLHVAPDGGWGHYWDGIGTRDYERDRSEEIRKEPWQTDTSIGDWTWNRNTTYRSAEQIIHELVDIVAKNGNMLLNVSPRADGSLDDDAVTLLNNIGDWMDINSESIYSTRYWQIPGVGSLRVVQKEGALYVTTFEWNDSQALLIPFLLTKQKGVKLQSVSLLGHKGKISYKETSKGLEINLPKEKPCKYAWVFKITGNNITDIDLSSLDLRNDEQKAKDAIKVWSSVSKYQRLSNSYSAAESNENDQQYAINKDGNIALVVANEETAFAQKAVDVSCSIKGDVVIVTPEGELKKKTGDGWKVIESPKKVSRVAVSPEGYIAVINNDSTIAHYDGKWKMLSGAGLDIGYGPDGIMACVGTGHSLYVNTGNGWNGVGGRHIAKVCVSPKTGHCLVVNQSGEVYAWKGAWVQLDEKAKDIGCGKSNDDEVITIIKR